MEDYKIKYTRQGYSYVRCKPLDCYKWGGMNICDSCGENMTNNVYLIFVLASAYCEKCFNAWQKRAHRYEEDINLQGKNHLKWYKLQIPVVEE